MRLFFAVEIPSSARTRIERLQSLLRRSQADVCWVRPQSAHLTLVFLGEVDADEIVRIDRAARRCAGTARPMTLRLSGLGRFPKKGPPRTLWLGVKGDRDALIDLRETLQRAMANLGFEPERHAYQPHLTLGRVRGRRQLERLEDAMRTHENIDLAGFDAPRFVLMQSRLSRSGARYSLASTYDLAR